MSDLCLLDTHVLLWAVGRPQRLPQHIRDRIAAGAYAVSVASLWELVNKREKSDAPVREPSEWWQRYVVSQRTRVLPVQPGHVMRLETLPMLHKDPYDRILLAQSLVERMPLVTSDRDIHRYDISGIIRL